MHQKAIEEENEQHWLSVDKAESMDMLTSIYFYFYQLFLIIAPCFVNLSRVTSIFEYFIKSRMRTIKKIIFRKKNSFLNKFVIDQLI